MSNQGTGGAVSLNSSAINPDSESEDSIVLETDQNRFNSMGSGTNPAYDQSLYSKGEIKKPLVSPTKAAKLSSYDKHLNVDLSPQFFTDRISKSRGQSRRDVKGFRFDNTR